MNATPAFPRDRWARHHAANHYQIDEALVDIYHLPAHASEREIRLLEVNRLIPEFIDLEPIDFGMDREGDAQHSIVILDVTPGQWERIQSRELALPQGWSLDDLQHMERDARLPQLDLQS